MSPHTGRGGIDRFREYLRGRNLPVTPQRLRIAEIIFGTHSHISADEILDRLEAENQPVGKATVYRTLDLLLEAGLIREHDFGEGFRRYEPTWIHHEHLVCTSCGKVIEFQSEDVDRIESEMAALHRFHPTHHKMEIYGKCQECHEAS